MFKVQGIRSIGIRSAFLLLENISEILFREGYCVVKTRHNPKYVSANFVFFQQRPEMDDLEEWSRIFTAEFSDFSEIRHVKLEWDSSEPSKEVIELFLKNGFELEDYLTMTCSNLIEHQKIRKNLDIREISSEEQWESVLKDQIYFKPDGLSEEYYKEFSLALVDDYKKLVAKGKSKWFGVYVREQMVGSLGILWDGEMARFQRVVVNPKFQGQGFATNLVYAVSKWAFDHLKVKILVMLTERGSQGQKVYESIGFEVKERLLAFYKYPN